VGEDFFLEFYDRSVATGSVINILQSLRKIESGLQGANTIKYLSDHVCFSNAGMREPFA
jgi:hypothetical protein